MRRAISSIAGVAAAAAAAMPYAAGARTARVTVCGAGRAGQ